VVILRSIKDAEIKGKRVLMRVDFNVPQDKEGNIIDDTKIRAALPSINYVIENQGRLILMSHLGRPKGQPEEKYSLKKVGARLQELVNTPVTLASATVGPEVEKKVADLKPGQVLVLENVRFNPGEEKNDRDLSRQFASLGDLFVNDAFGTAHRAHSSTVGVADFLPAYAGFLMEREVSMLQKVLDNPEGPKMAIMGGAKISDKLGLIDNFINKLDIILIGGGMANTFLKAMGHNIGKSLHEEDLLEDARKLVEKAKARKVEILLPEDVVVAGEISATASTRVLDVNEVSNEMMILDIGPKTREKYRKAIARAKTIIWNGPMGVFEYQPFAAGTEAVARAIAESSAVSVAGGGETAAAVQKMGFNEKITHISTGGGATLEFLEGITLPGVAVCEIELSGVAGS
jgi:phosphoglycerate kinase